MSEQKEVHSTGAFVRDHALRQTLFVILLKSQHAAWHILFTVKLRERKQLIRQKYPRNENEICTEVTMIPKPISGPFIVSW